MERDRLPARPMIDTGVFIRWLREQTDAWTADCAHFVDACLKARRTVFVAAPTLAEVMLGTRFPIDIIKSVGSSSGLPHSYLKYDALIAASVLRANADVLVALDGDHTKLAAHAGIKVAHPSSFRGPQLPLPQP